MRLLSSSQHGDALRGRREQEVWFRWEQVFLAGECTYTGRRVADFAAMHRLTAGATPRPAG